MIIQCKSCSRQFIVKDSDIPKSGRTVQCGYCSVSWFQMPTSMKEENVKKTRTVKENLKSSKTEDSPSVDSIKASDGKTYKFLGSQWAELLPSGKTGLFARRKISQELDEITGRKKIKPPKKKRKEIGEVNPSDGIKTSKQLPDVYEPKKGLGFFGYVFLLIVITFSIVGILKTFESDLISSFPEVEYSYDLLNEQLLYVSESVKNIMVIFSDLLNSY